jgi:drug/metabolite transporter (DMT)-like permease
VRGDGRDGGGLGEGRSVGAAVGAVSSAAPAQVVPSGTVPEKAVAATAAWRHPPLPAYAAIAFGIVCIGFSAIFTKWAALPGPVSAFYRVAIAAAVLLPWRAAKRSALPAWYDLLLIGAGGVFFALDLALWNTSLLLTSATNAALLANLAPVWVGLGALAFVREQLARGFWLGLAAAMAGMAVLVGVESLRHMSLARGDLLAVGSSFLYAGYLLTTQRARSRVDTLTFMTVSTFVSAVVLFHVSLFFGQPLDGFTARAWWALAGLALVSHLGGWLALNYALGHLRAAPVSVSLLGQAVVTALLAIPLLGEGLAAHQIVGGVMVLGGIAWVNIQRG